MIVNYVGLVGALAATVALLALTTTATGKDLSKTAMRLHKTSAALVPAVWALGIVVIFATR
jgi:hypothetical protein